VVIPVTGLGVAVAGMAMVGFALVTVTMTFFVTLLEPLQLNV